MDNEIIYAIAGIAVLIIIIILTLYSGATNNVKSKEDKRGEILSAYKKQLREALAPLKNDKESRITMKSSLLKKFSDELSLNIFFDKSEWLLCNLVDDTLFEQVLRQFLLLISPFRIVICISVQRLRSFFYDKLGGLRQWNLPIVEQNPNER